MSKINLKNELKTTVIQKVELGEKPSKPRTDFQIRKATDEDFSYFKESNRYSDKDVKILSNADICVVVRKDGDVVHHNCIAIESFQPPGTSLPINISEREAYVYNAKTETEYRGKNIFQRAHEWRICELFDLGIRRIYSEVNYSNKASLRATEKVGFERCSKRYTLSVGKFNVHVITGPNIYSDTIELPSSDILFAKTYDDRFTRITSELETYVNRWMENDKEIVLFGSGIHSKKIIRSTELNSIVRYAIDDDESKIGSDIPGTSISVYPIEKITEDTPDVVIICSESFQSEMISRIKKYSDDVDIVVLYPHVRLLEKEND